MPIDLDKIKDELKLLPNFNDQICLQGVTDNPDPFFGCGTISNIKPYKETDFTEPNFNLPYINSIIEELNSLNLSRDTDRMIESSASNIIESAINLLNRIGNTYDDATAGELERRFLNSIKSGDPRKFKRGIQKVIESKSNDK